MKSSRLLIALTLSLLFSASTLVLAQEERFDLFLRDFDYEMRVEIVFRGWHAAVSGILISTV